MKKEYVLFSIIGLFILAYVLDGVVNPLTLHLPSPYHYFTPHLLSTYTFTTVSIVIKGAAVAMAFLWFLSFLEFSTLTRGSILLVLSGLMQLYALQDVATNSKVIPLEWSLSFTLAGVALLIVAIGFLIVGFMHQAGQAIAGESPPPPPTDQAQTEPTDDDDFFKTL